ncbi:MAG: queuosine precursor transporter [Bacteroidetes bacterium]|nr:queuosine precursor transporter [Bacteroidota bacterium]
MISTVLKDKSIRLFLLLSGFFVTNALVAEVIGVKVFSLEKTLGFDTFQIRILGNVLSFDLTAGVLLWPMVFVLTDIINEYYGQRGVRFLSWMTAGLITLTFIYFSGAIWLAPADFFVSGKSGSGVPNMQLAYQAVLGQSNFIIIGSLTAFLAGQLVDVYIFHRIKKRTGEKHIWLRATGSTLVSQLLDSFVVLFIAFYWGTRFNQHQDDFVWPFSLVLAVGSVNYLYKFVIALLMTPVVYGVHDLIERYLGKEKADAMKKAAMLDQ